MTIQSGLLSAFGMAPETKFRKVPLTTNQVGIANTNPHRFWTVESDGGFPAKPDILVPYDEQDGSSSLRRTVLQAKDYNGAKSFKLDAENLVIALLGVFGKAVQTQLAGVTTTTTTHVFQQVFTKGDTKPSFVAEEIFGIGQYGRLSSGVVIPRLDVTLGRTLMGAMQAVPYRQVPNRYIDNSGADVDYDWTNALQDLPGAMQDGTEHVQAKITTVPTYIDVVPGACGDGPFVHARIVHGSEATFGTTFFRLNDTTDMNFSVPEGSSFSAFFDAESHHIMGSGYDPGAVNGNAFHVDGKFDVLFEDNSILKNILAKCYFGVNFKVQGILIGNSGIRYSMEVFIPRFRFLTAETTTPARAMMTGGNWVAEQDPARGYEAKITLVNACDISAWGGKVSDNPGGMGGWINS